QEHAGGLGGQPLAALWILGEQIAQVSAAHRRIVICKRLPCCALADRARGRFLRLCSHLRHPSLIVQLRWFARRSRCEGASCWPHSRKPPTKALALSPSRVCGGSVSSFFTLPPPITVSSGSSAAMKRATTSATSRRHFFLPWRFNPASP